MSLGHDRIARTQALSRELNEEIEHFPERPRSDEYDRILCECGHPNCRRQLELTQPEYEQVRAHASRFIVALNHENPETESVVEQNERFAVVETYAGAASDIARETDPRSQQHVRRAAEEAVLRGEAR